MPALKTKLLVLQNLAQNASTTEDWELVQSRLQQAIALMKTVPANSPKRAITQKRQATYQQQMKMAQQQSQKLVKGNTSTLLSTKGNPAELTARAGSAPAISGSSLTLENYSRIQFGMSSDEVRSLLGPPTREDGNQPDIAWTWESPDEKTTVGIMFYENKAVGRVKNAYP